MTSNSNPYERLSSPQPSTAEPGQTPEVTVVPSASDNVVKPRETHKRMLYKLGLTEVVLGVTSCLFCIMTIAFAATTAPHSYTDYTGQVYYYGPDFTTTYMSAGIWCAAFLFASGGLGIRAKKIPSVCIYNANMVMSIIASVMMATLVIISSTVASTSWCDCPALIAMHSLLAIVAFAAMVICIIHSAYCCAGTCCRRKHYSGAVMYTAQHVVQPQQFVQLANGQFMLIQSQPLVQQAYPFTVIPATTMPVAMVPQNAAGASIPGTSMPVTMLPPQSAAQQLGPPQRQEPAPMTKQQEAGVPSGI